ncbi:OPT/YSL family transporter [Sporomusa acidovorans]|uniref:OPT oligopeptide transporter protein n=1 Tax=Sporomusa acidovorans (strain ATCC 49682 / DSM 3132 / Mol) TaxID=1123286 RepID=A0ABZ3JBH3_SPOA4|nr:OPT/YSL family transporter [Sporomusa acidovorans]OZC18592.1 OPT oligopeptide transporter protein [Sporomusa acidovorans DSM 3132]SDF52349.1 Uncharacterized membrane protein, oligopeptide transporter (OPT) family [Sporomusa acidovorans]
MEKSIKRESTLELEHYVPTDVPAQHPSSFEPMVFILNILMSVVGAIIGLQLIVQLGISTNTAIIGAMVAMFVARIPLQIFQKFLSIHRQNLVQTAVSSATFGASNSLLLPIGIPWLLGRIDLVLPTFIGVTCAMFLDAILLYFMYDSKVFPGSGIWPPGVATAESIIAGDQGGKRARLLLVGLVGGIAGAVFKIPMSAFGVAFIGNIWALTMFGVGLLVRGYSVQFFGVDINQLYIPHGIMVGAGIVALIQIFFIMKNRSDAQLKAQAVEGAVSYTRSNEQVRKALGTGFVLYLLIACMLAAITGLYTEMSSGMFAFWIIFAAFAAIVHELIVGLAAMHAGWFPAFATALIFLILGMIIGFPGVALAVLVGFCATTGPAFADMGYDLKTGWILRGRDRFPDFELQGRKQQLFAALTGFTVAVICTGLTYTLYFQQNLFPPVDKVYIATIKAGLGDPQISKYLLMWAVPGALIQWLGGSQRQMGVLFATGLLILYPQAGIAVLVAIVIRMLCARIWGERARGPQYILAAGFIAGDALYSFFNSIWKLKIK